MSRRFGRNQRRRLREELAAAQTAKDRFETAWHREAGLLRHVSDKRQEAEERLLEIYEMLPALCMLAPPKRREVQSLDTPFYAVAPPRGRPDLGDTVPIVALHAVSAAVDEDLLRHSLHATLTCKGEKVAYAVTEEALYGMGEQQLVRLVERQIAPLLTKALIECLRKRRRA